MQLNGNPAASSTHLHRADAKLHTEPANVMDPQGCAHKAQHAGDVQGVDALGWITG